LLRIKPKSKENIIGSIEDIMGNIYNAYEILIHTPADHVINGEKYNMEIQVMHEAVAGDFKRKAGLSILFKIQAGAKNAFFDSLDIMDLPNADNPKPEKNLIKNNFHIY